MTIADQIDFDEIEETIDASNLFICAGLIDPHTHLREPGFEYKETIETGTQSMAKGGFTTVFSMPNTKPVCDSVMAIKQQLDIIKNKSKIKVFVKPDFYRDFHDRLSGRLRRSMQCERVCVRACM